MHFYKWLERTYPTNGNIITANVKDATAELRELAKAKLAELQGAFNAPMAYAIA